MLVKKELDNIMDTFVGADGGISFLKLKMFLESVSKQAEAGDTSAIGVLNVVLTFDRLIKIANK